MKAAVLNAFGAPLAIESLPDPVLGLGSVVVDVRRRRGRRLRRPAFSPGRETT